MGLATDARAAVHVLRKTGIPLECGGHETDVGAGTDEFRA